MHDIKIIRENPTAFDEALAKRNLQPLSEIILSLDTERRKQIFEFETAKAKQNEITKRMAKERAVLSDTDFNFLRDSLVEKKSLMNKQIGINKS